MTIESEAKLREEQWREFFELEILHLLKSGSENPKITEHFLKRVREFLKLPEEMALQPIVLGDAESIRNLAGMISRVKTDIAYIESRIDKLQHELGHSTVSPQTITVTLPKPDDESGGRPNI